jgi:hypothetical protein
MAIYMNKNVRNLTYKYIIIWILKHILLELARAGQFQDRGRQRHRVFLHKALGNRSRSRSCSPSPVSDLQFQVENRRINIFKRLLKRFPICSDPSKKPFSKVSTSSRQTSSLTYNVKIEKES